MPQTALYEGRLWFLRHFIYVTQPMNNQGMHQKMLSGSDTSPEKKDVQME